MANLEFDRDFVVLPKEIFVFFVPQRMPLWYGAEMNSCFEVQGGAPDFAVGQKVRITGRLAEREVTLTTRGHSLPMGVFIRVAISGFLWRTRKAALGTSTDG